MYARTVNRPKQRKAELKRFPAPVAGWISNRNIAQPAAEAQQQGAAILDNWFPTATTARMRRGKLIYATLGQGDADVTALFSYNLGANQKLFGSTPTTVYDITSILSPENYRIATELGEEFITDTGDYIGQLSTDGLDVWTSTGGDWIVLQYTTTGGTYLMGVNGESTGFIYDGANFWPWIAGGITSLGFDTVVTPFTVGEVITGGTSGATATIYKIDGSTLYLQNVTSTFVNDEVITGSLGGDALVNGSPANVVPGITFSGGVTTANMSYVFVYQNRVWLIQKNTMSAWYLDVDSVGGTATVYNPGAEFSRGGSILFGERWSSATAGQGGLSEQIIFVSTEGEIVTYQGLSPEDTTSWLKVGLYRVGNPLGKRAWVRAGADILIATTVGFVSVAKASQMEFAALSPAAVSYPIEDAWNEATEVRGTENWVCELWPESQMCIVSPPIPSGSNEPTLFVSNALTGAWCRFTNWHVLSTEVFRGRLYFGSKEGRVYLANATGYDHNDTYTATFLPLFEDYGTPASLKIAGMGRAVVRAKAIINDRIRAKFDFDTDVGPAPAATPVNIGGTWGSAVWGQSTWGEEALSILNQRWRSLGGSGYAGSMSLQITSGSLSPLDAEIIRIEESYTTADIMS